MTDRIHMSGRSDQDNQAGRGKPTGTERRGLVLRDRIGMPFAGVYLSGSPQFDVEVWSNGNLLHRIPSKTPESEAVYDALDSGVQELRPPRPSTFLSERYATLEELRDELHTHPGQIAELLWDGLTRTLAVHRTNAAELQQLLDLLAKSDEVAVEMMQNVRDDPVRRDVLLRIDQKLHNYVASTKSLVNHGRQVIRKYSGTHLAFEYEVRRADQ